MFNLIGSIIGIIVVLIAGIAVEHYFGLFAKLKSWFGGIGAGP